MIRGNTSDFIDHPLPKHFVSARGASHHAWAPGPHHLNPALVLHAHSQFLCGLGSVKLPTLGVRQPHTFSA